MFINKAKSFDNVGADVAKGGGANARLKGGGIFTVRCRDKEGNLKWEQKSHNLVVNVGLADMNTKYFKGSGYTAAWYLGIYGPASSNNPSSTDTMASHAGWTEDGLQQRDPSCCDLRRCHHGRSFGYRELCFPGTVSGQRFCQCRWSVPDHWRPPRWFVRNLVLCL
jgi:hypothetical protein